MPTVSVVTPTYNRAPTVHRAIESVQQQTFQDFEHIIVDDGSTDKTQEVVEAINNERIQYLQLEGNHGANAARNRGIETASGRFIAFLDSDDRFHPEKLGTCVGELEELEEEFAGVCHSIQFGDRDDVIEVSSVPKGEIGLGALRQGNLIGGFSDVMFRSKIFDEVGMLDEDMPAYQDYEFFLRVLAEFKMYGIQTPLSIKHKSVPEGSAPRISDQLGEKSRAQRLLLEKHSDRISPKVSSEFHYTRGLLRMDRREVHKARTEFKRAIRLYPKDPRYLYHLLATLCGGRYFDVAIKVKKKVMLKLYS